MAEVTDESAIFPKRKAICALLPYAIHLSGGGEQQMIDTFSRVSRHFIYFQGFVWNCVEPFIARLFGEPRTPSLDKAITIVSPRFNFFNQNRFAQWSTAALATLAVPYTEEAGRSVADTLWQIISDGALQQHIPAGIWLWSSKQTFIPPAWLRDRFGGDPRGEAVRKFRALGDTEILKSYLLFIWLDWSPLQDSALAEMCTSIREEFNGIGMGHHREELRKRLDHVLGQLDQGWDYLNRHRPDLCYFRINTEVTKGQYRELKRALLEVDRQAMDMLTRTSSRFIILFDLLTSVGTYRISLDVYV